MRLPDIQHDFAHSLLTGAALPPIFAAGPVPVDAALRVHRNTVLGAGVNALRLGFPTVDRLVGEAFFDRVASAFMRAHPPRAARLSAYGDGFADFLAAYPPAAGLPYLADVARLDLAIARAAEQSDGEHGFALDGQVTLMLPASLAVLWLDHPADAIRDALDAGDDAALGAIDLSRRVRPLLVWRRGKGAAVQSVSAPAAAFAGALMAGGTPDAALTAAIFQAEPDAALAAIRAEIFPAPFSRILTGDRP